MRHWLGPSRRCVAHASFPAFNSDSEWDRQLVSWERDRIAGVAKALASSAVGFLFALLTAVIKDEVGDNVSALALIGCMLGSIGNLLAAAAILARAGAFLRNLPPEATTPDVQRETLSWCNPKSSTHALAVPALRSLSQR